MDLTPDRVRDVQFHAKVRGYSPVEVDTFLADIADGLETLLNRLHALEAAEVGRMGRSTSGGPVTEETLARALLIAQRTADLAIAEAEDAAIAVRDQARAEATRIINEAETHAAAVAAAARAAALAAVADLSQQRDALEEAVRLLRGRAIRYRETLKELLAGHSLAVDDWLVHHPAGDLDGPGRESTLVSAEHLSSSDEPPLDIAAVEREAARAPTPVTDIFQPAACWEPVEGSDGLLR